jgi:hypothetical protein
MFGAGQAVRGWCVKEVGWLRFNIMSAFIFTRCCRREDENERERAEVGDDSGAASSSQRLY